MAHANEADHESDLPRRSSTATIPIAPGALPLLGHGLPMLRRAPEFLASLAARGDLVWIRIGPVRAVMVTDADLTHQVLRDDKTFDKGGPFITVVRDIAGDNLVGTPHARHRRQRRLLQPAFHQNRFAEYATTMSAQIAERVGSWREGEVLDVPAQLAMLTTNVLTATMFSDHLTEAELRRSKRDLDVIVDSVLPRMMLAGPLSRLPLPVNRRFERARARIRRTVVEIVDARRAAGVGDRGDLLSALLAARDSESTGEQQVLSDDEIANQMMTFHIAGTETVAITLTWALHLVAAHPHVERRLHEEVDAVLTGRTAAHDDLPRLELTTRIVTETLRHRSPVWLLTREVTADTELGGHHLPAGTTVAYSPYLVHHRPDVYSDPERFDPDRWDPARHPAPPRTAFIPFTNGARRCIGDKFAIHECVLALATIARNWRLTHVPGETVRPAASFAMKPHRLRMRVTARA
ncbi:MAG: cytochrome P450 [Saccharothrix sp.]|nr:cytochrome P450 [Saccharothrix sp.]